MFGCLGWRPWEPWEQDLTTLAFQEAVSGALHDYLLRQDLMGELRVDIHRAAGSKFHDMPSGPGPAADAPTFEKVVGRERLPYFPAVPKPQEPTVEEQIKEEEDADRIRRAELALTEALYKRDFPAKVAAPTPPPEPPGA